tara:strand:- start:53 stop:265 length:213 start_codon:yes stop_codon:yes gene_type:complete
LECNTNFERISNFASWKVESALLWCPFVFVSKEEEEEKDQKVVFFFFGFFLLDDDDTILMEKKSRTRAYY